MNDGIFAFRVIRPLIAPTINPVKRPPDTAKPKGIPELNRFAMLSAESVKVAPTERSYSPAIIRMPTPTAMMPS